MSGRHPSGGEIRVNRELVDRVRLLERENLAMRGVLGCALIKLGDGLLVPRVVMEEGLSGVVKVEVSGPSFYRVSYEPMVLGSDGEVK